MKITKAEFFTSAADKEGLPQWNLPEFAFIGRSNVGKSSLLNLLSNRKGLARVSGKPGATQLVNFFRINEKWCLVDLPGYGYSKAPQSIRDGFQKNVSEYLLGREHGRENLYCVFVLIDSRHKPQKIDIDFCLWLVEWEIPFVLVFTKTDKVKKKMLESNIDRFLAALSEHSDGAPRVFRSSSAKNEGREEILQFIRQAMEARLNP